ncbi:MAG TPA: MFS transporter [Polyangia bacterium]|nr:MFS transporter [Polyangia bacterium]
MSSAPLTAPPPPASAPSRRLRGIAPLPLLTLINFFNYLDRQVVYGMTPHIQSAFNLTNFKLGWLAWANLFVFAVASLISGPIADRVGPRKVIFTGILVWSIATIGSALSTSFPMLLFFRALVGVGEGAYGPSANTLLCADAPPEKRGRAMGIYNIGMALGGTSGLVLGAVVAPYLGWRGVFWIAGGPSIALTVAAAFIAAPDRVARPQTLPARAFLLSPTYIMAVAGGVLATFGASALIFWVRQLVIEERHLSVNFGALYMAFVGLFCGAGGVIVGGYMGDAFNRRARGGHALTIGLSMLVAVPIGAAALIVTRQPLFLTLTAGAAFLLSVYNGPSAAVIDELGPPQYGATLQAVSMFSLHVFGNSIAPSVIGRISDTWHVPISTALQAAIAAFGLSGVLFVIVARRQRTGPSYH